MRGFYNLSGSLKKGHLPSKTECVREHMANSDVKIFYMHYHPRGTIMNMSV